MSYLTADESMCDRLRGILEPVEIRDAEGKVLGLYTPHVSPEELAAYEKARSRFDPTEMQRRRASANGQGKPFVEIIRRLQAGDFPE